MARIIDVPAYVAKVHLSVMKDRVLSEADLEFDFRKWATMGLETYAPLGKGRANQRLAESIFSKIEEEGKTAIKLENAEYDTLKAASEAMDWLPAANRKFGPFYEALEKAQEVTL